VESNKNGDYGGHHKDNDGNQTPRRKSREATDTMTTGAPVTQLGTDSDEQTTGD